MRQKKIVRVVVLIIAGFVVIGAGTVIVNWPCVAKWYTWHKSMPDEEAQHATAWISVADIRSMEIETARGIVKVMDPATIGLLLRGLQKATQPEPRLLNRIDNISIKLKSGKIVGPFYFSLDREVDSFSPEFVSGLRSAGIQVPR